MFTAARARLRSLGPGLVLAAAGIGAGDVVVASVTGIKFGTTLLWAIVFTAALKFVLTEALARWQLATGETVARAWVTRLPRCVAWVFAGYLLFWTFMVGASLSSACGLAGASLFPALEGLSIPVWGALHASAAALLVASNRYARFQRVMKVLIAVMAGCVLVCAVLAAPSVLAVVRGLVVPNVPLAGGGAQILALLGGIGGSVTVICYGYWMRAAAWRGPEKLPTVRSDVRLAYVFTGLFGVALVVIAAGVNAQGAGGARIALEIAARLESVAGPIARWIFLAGFWCTVFTAMLGVWQGVPQVYVDLIGAWRKQPGSRVDGIFAADDQLQKGRDPSQASASSAPAEPPANAIVRSGADRAVYLAALGYLAGPPLILLWFHEPVSVVVTFSIAGAFFMPFLAATLLYLNNRREWMGLLANRWLGNSALVICLLVFGAVCVREIVRALGK
jgi:Mn2+/Fe2+ NRAMP family transporter